MGNACSENGQSGSTEGKKPLTNKGTFVDYKVVILGDSAVGKTSVALRFVDNKFSDAHIVTLGATFQQPKIQLKSGQTVKLNLWDTTGEEKFRSMLPMYYKSAKGAILTYDIGSKKSFESVGYWIEELSEHVKSENVVLFLVGNKKDLPMEDRQIPTETAAALAKEHNMLFLEVSAKMGDNINELFLTLAEELAKRFKA